MKNEKWLSDFWVKYYATDHCTLCGNTGYINTIATAVTPAGLRVGRVNFCICPNGIAFAKINGVIK